MTNGNFNFGDDILRGKYARDISWLLGENNLNWFASASAKKSEIFIHPKDGPDENLRKVSRISLQIRNDVISFGVSGYYPNQIREIKKILENKGYKYHKKDFNKYGNPDNGRWWLVKSLYNIESLVGEFRDIGHLLCEKT